MKRKKWLAAGCVGVGLWASVVGCGTGGGAAAGNAHAAAPPTRASANQTATATTPADSFPNQTITLIVPYSPGGDFDTTARILAPYLSKYLPNHPPVIVKNVPGGNSVIGDMQVINAKPDGYTLGYFTLPAIALGPLIGQGDYDLTQVAWVGQVFSMPHVAVASMKSGITDLKSLQAKQHLRIGTTGITTTGGLDTYITMKRLGVQQPVYVPSSGSSQVVLATVQGAVDYMESPYPPLAQEIKAGMLKPLWVDAAQRLPELPNVPTIAELGYPDLAATMNVGGVIGTTPGVPPTHLQLLREALQKAMHDP
ncbi:MAG: tripartite tricarboxylate transporter substrate binding protein, partial [Alicyclobacillus sp.]|nr:tripartite tricarboxylate transporter substrate binding protein [Alicyclobacillus sp.]